MQTFLPYSDFQKSAECLDFRRLGKQRVEAKQIYLALTDPNYGWQNHPAVKMWKNHSEYLLFYGVVICEEWISRGYKDTLRSWFLDRMPTIEELMSWYEIPTWITPEFCRAHQSNLIRKNPEHYQKYFPEVPNNLPYIWPL